MITITLLLSALSLNTPLGSTPRILHFEKSFDYPRGASKGGLVRGRLTFNPKGHVIHCDIVVSSDSQPVDAAMCRWWSSAIAKPAKDAGGKSTYGAMTMGVTLVNADAVTTPPNVDISLAVSKMPSGSPEVVNVLAALTVNIDGVVADCSTGPQSNTPSAFSPFYKAICEMAHRLSFKPALNEAGMPVSSVQLFTAEFSSAEAPTERKVPLSPETKYRNSKY